MGKERPENIAKIKNPFPFPIKKKPKVALECYAERGFEIPGPVCSHPESAAKI